MPRQVPHLQVETSWDGGHVYSMQSFPPGVHSMEEIIQEKMDTEQETAKDCMAKILNITTGCRFLRQMGNCMPRVQHEHHVHSFLRSPIMSQMKYVLNGFGFSECPDILPVKLGFTGHLRSH